MDAKAAGVELARISIGPESGRMHRARQVFEQCTDYGSFAEIENAAWRAAERFASGVDAASSAKAWLGEVLFPQWRVWSTPPRGR